MQDVELIQKELSELTGRKARLGSPQRTQICPKCGAEMEVIATLETEPITEVWRCPICGQQLTQAIPTGPAAEDERLRDLERQIAEHEARMAELKRLIAELEAKVGWTAEEEAERARLQSLIDAEETSIHNWQNKVSELEKEVPLWKARSDTAKNLLQACVNYLEKSYWETRTGPAEVSCRLLIRPEVPDNLIKGYSNAWGGDAIELVSLDKPALGLIPTTDRARLLFENYIPNYVDRFKDSSTEWIKGHYDDVVSGKGYDADWRPTVARACQEVLWGRNIKYPPQLNVVERATDYINRLRPQVEMAERNHYDFYTELRNAKDELERAYRRLWDAKAALERYELAITRAIALRQAEVEAAKARHELELRTLDNLKATYNALLKEIEAARTQAIAEAARQREEVIKAAEEDRLRIAEEQRKIAEEYEKLAAESAGLEREEYLDKMRRAEDIAEDAEEAAIAAAKEREALAVDIATRKAELARMELDLEELRKQLAITAERKEEAEKKVAGLPAIPKWGWIALGVGGITATAGGIAYAIKKKKKKVKSTTPP